MTETVLIIGLGLIGSSLAHGLKASGGNYTLLGFDGSEDVRRRAAKIGFCDRIEDNLAAAVRQADIIVLCVPVGAYRAVAAEIAPHMVTVPYLSTGATDSARLRKLGMQAYGILPFPMDQDDEDRMHGNDERIPTASLEFGTRLIFGAVLRVAK